MEVNPLRDAQSRWYRAGLMILARS